MKDATMRLLFVAMPFGKKTSFLDPAHPEILETIDFDPIWDKILAPAIPPEFNAMRADNAKGSGIIDKDYIEQLLNADVD